MRDEKTGEDRIVKVNCSFCGKEIECPENMLNVEGHMCYECYRNPSIEISEKNLSKVHIDLPTDKLKETFYENITKDIKEKIFPGLWRERKEKLKDLSKKELAELMLIEGAINGANILFEGMIISDYIKEKDNELK